MNKRLIARLMQKRVLGIKYSGVYFFRGSHEHILRESVELGADIGSNGALCIHAQACTGLIAGLPLQGEIGINTGVGTGSLCSGSQRTYGAFYFGGAGIMGGAQFTGNSEGSSLGKGSLGIGGSPEGAAVGMGGLVCETKYWCTK